MDILETLYKPGEVWVSGALYDPRRPHMTVTCRVPRGQQYTAREITYVTAENYVRILSQACYLLAYHVVEKKLVPLEVTLEDLVHAMLGHELYYRNLSMTFHERVAREEPFTMTLELVDFRSVRRVTDFVIFSFKNHRTVISGEMSFVYAARRPTNK